MLNNKIDLGELKDQEIQLIDLIRRRFRYGEITILVRDGIPIRILKAFESQQVEDFS